MRGGVAGLIGRVVGGPRLGALAGELAHGMESRVTVVALTLIDIRSTTQIGISEGSATTTNISRSMGGWAGLLGVVGVAGVGGGISSFTRTPEGQATAAAFFDAYNSMVQSLQNYKAQNVDGGLGRGGELHVN